MTDLADTVAPDVRPRRGPRTPVLVSIVVVAVVVVVGAVWFSHWRSRLHVLTRYPVYAVSTPESTGHHLYFGGEAVAARTFADPHDRAALAIDVTAVTPLVETNTSDASIVVLRCDNTGVGAGLIGDDRETAEADCSSLTPFRSGTVHLGSARGESDLVVEVSPRHDGVVRISGVTIEYRSGLRHGTQHAGVRIRCTTKIGR